LGSAILLTSLLGTVVPTVSADPASPLTVTKTANPNPATSGGLLTYTISIKNTSGAKVDTVVLTDQINGVGTVQAPPALPQLTITSTQGPCSQGGPNGNLVTCQIGSMAGLGTATVTISGQVTAAGNTVLNNTASVTGTKSAQNFTTNASVSVQVQPAASPKPDLTLNKTGPTTVAINTPMTYTLTVNNLGNANTANVKVVDTLPSGVTLQATTPFETTSLFGCSSNAPANPITIVCLGGTVNAGQNATIKINAKSPGVTGQITNTAIVDPDNTISESNELNNSSAAVNTSVTSTPPAPPALTIVKTDNNPTSYAWSAGAGPDPVNPGQLLTYKIQVKNTSTTRADDVTITDGTQALEAASITVSQVVANGTVGNGGGCTVTGAQVRCLDRTLNAGGTITVTISGIVVTGAGANIFNTATVTGNIKNQGAQASASESTTVRPAVDLTITKAGPPDPVCARTWPTTSNPGAQHLANFPGTPNASGNIPGVGLLDKPVCLGGLTYHFVVGNSGQAQANGVAIRDWLPAGVLFDSYQSSMPGLTCTVNSSNVINCSGGAVGPASTETIDFLVVAPPTLGTITNSVTVDPNNAIFEPDETNNDATTTTDVRTGIDLVVWKGDNGHKAPFDDPPGPVGPLSEGFDPVATSGTDTYTIVVDNVGTQDATGIKVRDTLPAGTKFLSVTANQGFTCSHDGSATGGNVTCISGHLRGTESEFYVPNGSAGPSVGDEYAIIKIRVFATPFVQQTGQTMHNEVRVDPDNEIAEYNELNNLATDDTVVTTGDDNISAFNQLTVDKTQVSPAGAVATNGMLTYNLHVANLGTDPVSNVVVQDYLPSGSRFISATDITLGGPASAKFFCTHDGSPTGGTITCVGGDFSGSINVIQPGPVPTARDIKVKVFAPNTPQTASNTTTVDPANVVPEGNEFDNDDQQDTDVRPCTSVSDCSTTNAVYELTIKKTKITPTPDPVARNGIITYDLEVANLGSDPVSGVTVTDRLPAGFRFISAKDLANGQQEAFTCNGPDASGTVTCSGGSLSGQVLALQSGAPTTRHIRIRVFAPDIPGTYINNAFVDPSNTIPEGNEFNNQSSLETDVENGGSGAFIDLSAKKVQITPDPGVDGGKVAPGGQLAYRITVKNEATGPDSGTAFNVRVRDTLPLHTAYFSAFDTGFGTPGSFTCAQANGVVDCTGGTLPPGVSRDIIVAVTAPTDITQFASDLKDIQIDVQNQVFVDPDNEILEGDETNNFGQAITTVRSKINLTVDKEGPDTANQNQTADYKITVKNVADYGGGAIAFNTKVVDALPVGLIPLSVVADPSNMICQIQENPVNLVTCIGDVEPGKDVTITVHVFITADGGKLDNEACVDPDHQVQETNELDNCKTKTTEAQPEAKPNLNINKSASKSTVTAGETFTYSVTASNVGNATASGSIKITDDLPDQVTYQNATATNGFTCAEASTIVTCTGSDLAAGASTVVTIEVKVNEGVTAGFSNTATVEGAGQSKDASVSTNVGGASIDLVTSDITDSPDPANVGQNVTYTFTVTNAGTNDSGAFDITSTMDDVTGLKFIGASASQGFTCAAIVGKTVTCSGAGLPAGQSTNVTITFQVTAGSPSTHELTVKADSGDTVTESSEANNQQTELTSITGALCTSCVDLVIGGILDTPDPVTDGQTLTFITTASNAGDIPTTGNGPVVLRFYLPIGVDFANNPGDMTATAGFTCSYTDPFSLGIIDYVDCTGDLLAGQGVVMTVKTTASDSERDTWLPSGTELLISSATVDPDDAFPEGSGADHEFTNANNGPIDETTTFPD
jgi:uncharacterized repeat protein (TIGR01451 family)